LDLAASGLSYFCLHLFCLFRRQTCISDRENCRISGRFALMDKPVQRAQNDDGRCDALNNFCPKVARPSLR
jgi:hypothetical protein